MKNKLSLLLLVLCAFVCMNVEAQFASAPAFPGAEGHGRYTTGGRGGTVVHVTNLNDSGEGSFRAAVTGGSNRTIVFDVAGVIALQSDIQMKDNLTILGQTAPSPGITLRYYTVRPGGNNIIRFIRIRRGQEKDVNEGADATWQRQKTNIILDHCSFSWSIDEVASFYDNNNFTMQWCTIGEALNNAGHGKGAHGYGGIWGGKLASFHHNMLIHLNNRVPRFNGARYNWNGYTSNKEYSTYNWQNAVQSENVDFRNCVMYNWGNGNGCYGGPGGGQINIVNNYYKAGPATGNKTRVTQISFAESGNIGDDQTFINMSSRYYINGNYVTAASSPANYDWSGVVYDVKTYIKDGEYYTPDAGGYYNATHTTINSTSCVKIKMDTPAPIGSVTTHTAENAYTKVLDYAGASLYRDNVDERYAREIKNNNPEYTGSVSNKKGIIDVVADVEGYTEANFGTGSHSANYDTDGDGIPDEWETAHGLTVGVDNSKTYNLDPNNYYTDLEVYANYLVQHITKAERAGATETFTEYYPLDDDPSALLPTTITVSPASVNITGTASATVTLSSNNTEGAYSISSAPNSAVATATISGNVITITGVAAGTTSLTVSQDASSTHKAGTKTISITVSDAQGGGSTEEFHVITSSEETILLTKANIEANNYLSAGTSDWNAGKTYGGVSGDFYNLSSTDRTLTIKLADCSKIKINVQNSTANRTYSYSINGGNDVPVNHGGTGTETTEEIEVPSGNVTVVLKGGGSSVYPVSIIAYKRESSRDTSCDKNLSNNSYTIASGDKAVSGTMIVGADITMTYGDDTWNDAKTESTHPDGYEYFIAGNGNPLPSNGSEPTSGCYYTFVPTKDGNLNIAMLVNSGRNIYVVENGTSIGYKIGGTAYSAGSSLSEKTGDILSFPVTAGKTYYVYASGSKLGLFGWTLEEQSEIPGTDADDEDVTMMEDNVFSYTFTTSLSRSSTNVQAIGGTITLSLQESTAYVENTPTSTGAKLKGESDYIKVNLDRSLKKDDVIKVNVWQGGTSDTKKDTYGIYLSETNNSSTYVAKLDLRNLDKNTLQEKTYTITASDALVGKNEFYILGFFPSNKNVYVNSINVVGQVPVHNFTEDKEYDSFTEGTYNVKLKRSIPVKSWSTLVVPFDVTTDQLEKTFKDPANSEVAVITKFDGNTLYFKTQNHIKANEPVLIYLSQKNDDNVYDFGNVTVKNGTPESTSGGATMVGTYSTIQGTSLDKTKYYFISGGKFYDTSYLSSMKPFRAYFYISNPPGAKQLNLGFGDYVTGVEGNSIQIVDTEKPLYNMAGQRVKAGTKGLLIQNGKKIFIK